MNRRSFIAGLTATLLPTPAFAMDYVPSGKYDHRENSCARNVCRWLRQHGIEPPNTVHAKDFLKWGKTSLPVKGAVAVYHRGKKGGAAGHVAIVSHIEDDGTVWVLNPTRIGWHKCVYPTPAIDYRMPE